MVSPLLLLSGLFLKLTSMTDNVPISELRQIFKIRLHYMVTLYTCPHRVHQVDMSAAMMATRAMQAMCRSHLYLSRFLGVVYRFKTMMKIHSKMHALTTPIYHHHIFTLLSKWTHGHKSCTVFRPVPTTTLKIICITTHSARDS